MQLPKELASQTEKITAVLLSLCPGVTSVVLHGSIALGGYVPMQSDLDLLVFTDASLTRQQRIALADALLPLHRAPCAIELSVIRKTEASRIPVLCQFHFSEMWASRYAAHDERNPLLCGSFPDTDLPAYFKVAAQSGIVLFGEAPQSFLPEISDAAFFASISADCGEWDFADYGLFDSNILTFARVLSFARTGRILTKVQGAKWAMVQFPQWKGLLCRAIAAYETASHGTYCEQELESYRVFMVREIRRGLG